MGIADRLKRLREARNLSTSDMERMARLPSGELESIESGRCVPTPHSLQALADALDIPLYKLFCDSAGSPSFPHLPRRKTSDDIVSRKKR